MLTLRLRTLKLRTLGKAVLCAGVVLTASAALWLSSLSNGLPDAAALGRLGEMDQATAVFDSNRQLAFTIFKEQRMDVPLSQMSASVRAAILAIEDRRFYDHDGFDLRRMASAALTNLRRGHFVQGGSTITQQLARQSVLSADKTLSRKLQELMLAAKIERLYSKDQILELYLNKIYFGDGLYGIEAAARGFFGVHASQLSVAQAALLAGLVKSPSSYAPTINIERAVARRNLVLQAMVDTGAIDATTWQSARDEVPALVDGLRAAEPNGRYFKEQVRRELVERFGWQRVYQGGLRVFSTIDMSMQVAADEAVASGLTQLDARRAALTRRRDRRQGGADDTSPLQAALIAIEPSTGYVRAMTGGRDFDATSFNRAVQARRQPGSAFKPFVYAAALEADYTPATIIEHLNAPVSTVRGDWLPEDEHSTVDSMSLRTGLRTSSNRAAVRLMEDVGVAATVKYAATMGVGDLPKVPSIALGSAEVTLQSLTAAYAAFANRGVVQRPIFVTRVEDAEGNVLFEAEPQGTRAISEATAYLMADMMADVVDAGTAARVRTLGLTLPAAGKTGTTNDYNDAWFVGFTPSLVAGVWVGFDRPRTIMPGGFASDVAVPLWTSFMKSATRGAKPEWLTVPDDVVSADVCRLTGLLATEGCEHADMIDDRGRLVQQSVVYREYFAKGTQPTKRCGMHSSRSIFGSIAAVLWRSDDPPPPVRIEQAGLPPSSPSPVAERAPIGAETPPPAPRRRGFWARVFGLGKGDEPRGTATREAVRRGRTGEVR